MSLTVMTTALHAPPPAAAQSETKPANGRTRAGLVSLGLGLALSAFAALTIFSIQSEIRHGFVDLRHNRETEMLVSNAFVSLSEAQSNLRAYAVTGNETHVDVVRAISIELPRQSTQLHDKVRADADLTRLAQDFTVRIDAALTGMAALVDNRLIGPPDPPAQIARLAEINTLVDAARKAQLQLIAGIRDQLQVRRQDLADDVSSLIYAALILLAGAILASFNQTRRLAQEIVVYFNRQAASDKTIAGLSEQMTRSSAELAGLNRQLQLALRSARVAVFSVAADGRLDWLSHGDEAPLQNANLPESLADLAHEDDRRGIAAALEGAFTAGAPVDVEMRVVGSAAPIGWLKINIDPALGMEDGRALGSAVDITELKRREEGNFWLMRELSHRSKNLLAIVQAMSRQTARTAASTADFHERFTARLRALAAAHDVLVKAAYRGADLSELLRSQLGVGDEFIGARIVLSGPDVQMRPEAAQNFAMALHELAANALKFGALSVPAGHVEARWRVEGEGAEAKLAFDWTEHGGPAPKPSGKTGFGTTLISHNLPRSLHGKVTLEHLPEGTRCHIEAPLTAIRP